MKFFGMSLSKKNERFAEKGGRDVGFAQFFDQEIVPLGQKLEALRLKGLKNFFIYCSVMILAEASVVLFFYNVGMSWLYSAAEEEYIIVAMIIIFPPLFVSAIWNRFKSDMKEVLFKKIVSFFEDFKFNPSGNGESWKNDSDNWNSDSAAASWKLDKFKILPYHNNLELKNSVEGKYKDVDLKFVEVLAEICSKDLDSSGAWKKDHELWMKTYKGVVIKFDFAKSFKGQTIVKKDGGLVGNFLHQSKHSDDFGKLSRVELEDPEFEKMFQVFSSDQVEARYLLTTSFMERLKQLSNFFESDETEASFCEGSLLLAFRNSKNLFEPASLLHKVNLIAECKKIIEQMSLILDIVDILKLDEKTGL